MYIVVALPPRGMGHIASTPDNNGLVFRLKKDAYKCAKEISKRPKVQYCVVLALPTALEDYSIISTFCKGAKT